MINMEKLKKALYEKDNLAKILSNIELNKNSIKIECKNGHKVTILVSKILDGSWTCRNCNQRKHTIDDFHKIAKERNGKCLSDKYLGLNKHLDFECVMGHKWKATPNNIKNKMSWCPKCRDLFNEERCRYILEVLFDKKFIKCQPHFLQYTSYRNL
jgi:hypothetical protein